MEFNINAGQLFQVADEAANYAYSPYSKFRVGASVLYQDGSIYKGCNVENISYGLTICAERNAISSAVADGKTTGLIAIAIFSPDSKLCYPCGACRQWIAEFSKNAMVIVENTDGQPLFHTISELLPHSFKF